MTAADGGAFAQRVVLYLVVAIAFAAASVQVYWAFGDSPFTRIVAGIIVAAAVAVVAWWYVVLPLLARRRGRWRADPIEFAVVTPDTPWPVAVKLRIAALEEAGFTPRILHARAEGGAGATLVFLVHESRDVYAGITHITVRDAAFTSTRLMSRPGTRATLVLLDALAPAPFPAAPGQRDGREALRADSGGAA